MQVAERSRETKNLQKEPTTLRKPPTNSAFETIFYHWNLNPVRHVGASYRRDVCIKLVSIYVKFNKQCDLETILSQRKTKHVHNSKELVEFNSNIDTDCGHSVTFSIITCNDLKSCLLSNHLRHNILTNP